MTLAPPEVGQIIRYAYLWHRRAARGAEDGDKVRPCAIVLTLRRDPASADVHVVLLPITHSAPTNPEDAVAIPPRIAAKVGLDAAQNYLMLSELNTFLWPGPDVEDVATEDGHRAMLPAAFMAEVISAFATRLRAARVKTVRRSC